MIYERVITLEPQCCTPPIRLVPIAYRLTCSNSASLPARPRKMGLVTKAKLESEGPAFSACQKRHC